MVGSGRSDSCRRASCFSFRCISRGTLAHFRDAPREREGSLATSLSLHRDARRHSIPLPRARSRARRAIHSTPGTSPIRSGEGQWPLGATFAMLQVSRLHRGKEAVGVLERIRSRASYANVMATIAVVRRCRRHVVCRNHVAARQRGRATDQDRALSAPRNSKRGAVGSRAIKNGAINPRDLSSRNTGPHSRASQARQGPPGAPAVGPSRRNQLSWRACRGERIRRRRSPDPTSV